MVEIGEGISWDEGWSAPPRTSGEMKTQPKPQHDSDTDEIAPSNSEPARFIDPRHIGRAVNRSIDWG